jgi:hypothetical protein
LALRALQGEINSLSGGQTMASESQDSPRFIWQGVDLPRINPGDYKAVCSGWQGPAWLRFYKRWSLRLEFSLLDDGSLVSYFIGMGEDPKRAMPQGRRSNFYAAWTLANGEAPRKGQEMSLDAFKEPGLLYLVRVADSVKDGKDEEKPDAMRYSKVTKILNVERP